MEEILLKDICDLDNGYAFRSDDYVESSDTLNCRMSNIRPDGTFDILYSAKYLPDEFAEKYEDYLLNDGDLIIAMTDMAGDPKILGVPTVVDTKGYKLLLNQRVGKLRFIKPGVNADYLKLALQSKRVREYLKRFAGGGVQLNVSKKDILNAPVRMRTEEEQNYIADLFRRVLEIKKQREQELLCLDNLIKARFVEMFGDPKTNDKGFTKAPMGEYMTLLTDFSSNGSYKTLDSGVTMYDEPNYAWMVRTTDLESGDMSSIKYIDEKAYELLSKSKIYGGEIIMNKIGSAGKVYLMPEIDMPASLGRNAFMFRYDDRINVRFLFEQLVSEYGQTEIQQYVRGAVTKTITKDDARSVLVIVPEKELQDEYVEFVKQVDKSKVAVQKSLDETQKLFDSLMQEYFG